MKRRQGTSCLNVEIPSKLKRSIKADAANLDATMHLYATAALSLFIENPEKQALLEKAKVNSGDSVDEDHQTVLMEHPHVAPSSLKLSGANVKRTAKNKQSLSPTSS